MENKIKKSEELNGENFIDKTKEVSRENEEKIDSLREIVSQDYLSDEIKDLYALDYVSGSQRVWDILEDKQKASQKRETVKYKKYANKFEEDVFGRGGLMNFLEAQSIDFDNKKELEKELFNYLHTNNLKKILNLMVEKILEKEKGSLDDKEWENIKSAFSYYKYHPGDKRAKENFLDKFLNRGRMSVEKDSKKEEKRDGLDAGRNSNEDRFEKFSKDSDSLKENEKSQEEVSENPAPENESKEEAFSMDKFEEKYVLGKIYTNSAGEEIKIKDYNSKEGKVRIEILSNPFNDLGEDEDEDGNKTKEWEFRKKEDETEEEKVMDYEEFKRWFQDKSFFPEIEEDDRENSQESKEEIDKDEDWENKQDNLTEKQKEVVGFYMDQAGKAVAVSPVEGGKVEVALRGGREVFSPDRAGSILNKFKDDLQKFETEEDCIEYFKNNILNTDKNIGTDKDDFKVLEYLHDKENKYFKAKVEIKGREKEVFLDWLKNEIENIESERVQRLVERYGNFEEYDYKNNKTGEVFVVDDYYLNRMTGRMIVLLKNKESRLDTSLSVTQFRKNFKKLTSQQNQSNHQTKESIDRKGMQNKEISKKNAYNEEDMEAMLDKVSVQEGANQNNWKERGDHQREEKINLDPEEYDFIVNDLWNFVKEYKNETEDYIEKNKQDLKKEEKEEARQELLGNLWNKELPEVIEEASEVVKVTKKEDIIEYLKKKAEKLNKNS
jgi:hypothetical protein